jgi:hypothetical protein
VAVSGNYAYVAAQGELPAPQPQSPDTSTGTFDVVDVSNPAAPAIVGTPLQNSSLPAPWTGTNALQHICSVFVAGNYAYVTAFNSNRLTIIDISNPASPTIISSLQDNTNLELPADVAVSGSYAYVADQSPSSAHTSFTVVDVANPSAPAVVGSVVGQQALLAGAYRVRVHGNFAYVASADTDTVSAIDISDPASPRVAGSVTNETTLNVPLGLDFDANRGYIIADSAVAPGDPNPTYPPYTPSLTTGTIAAIQLDPAPIAVTITPTSGPASATGPTNASFSFSTSDQVATVQCQLDGAPLSPCTSPTTQTYSGLSVGSHTFTVEATDAVGNTASASYTTPANTAHPVVSGTDAVGQTVSCTQGTWTGNASSYTYSWTRDGAVIAGATDSTYRIASADAKHQLACSVRAANALGRAIAASASLPAPAGTGTVGHSTSLAGGTVSVNVSCDRVSGTVCHLTLTIAVTESFSGKKLIAVTATKKTSKTVILATKSVTLSAGKHTTIKLTLSRAGQALLTKLRKLPAKLALAERGSNRQSSTVSSQKLTFRKR